MGYFGPKASAMPHPRQYPIYTSSMTELWSHCHSWYHRHTPQVRMGAQKARTTASMLDAPASGQANLPGRNDRQGVRTLPRSWPISAERENADSPLCRVTPMHYAWRQGALCTCQALTGVRQERSAQAKQRTGETGGRNAEAQCSRRGASQRDAAIPRCDTQRDAAARCCACTLPLDMLDRAVPGRAGGTKLLDSGHFGS